MTLPIGPIWSVLHLAIKFPAVTAVAVVGTTLATADFSTTAIQRAESNIPESGPMIAFTFDDGWRSVYDNALPMLAERGYVATNYITTNFIDSWDVPEGYISAHHVAEFDNAGWEIGGHSLEHEDMAKMPAWQVEENIVQPQERLRELSTQDVMAFSTPFGSYNDTVIRFAEVNHTTHVNAFSPARGVNTLENFDMFNIHRIDTQIATVEEVCTTVANLGEDEFYVIIFHRIDDSGADYSLTPKRLGAILDCVGASQTQVVTISDGAESMMRRLGDE